MKKHSPNFFQMARRMALLSISAGILVACGGGGDGGGGGSDPTPAAKTRSWAMDSYTFYDSVFSQQGSNVGLDGRKVTTILLQSDIVQGSGPYEGDRLDIRFYGASSGTYTIVPSLTAFVSDKAPANAMVIDSILIGSGAKGGNIYTSMSGQVTVNFDAAGKAHFAAAAPLDFAKTSVSQGGIAGSPETMKLTFNDPS